MWAFAIWDTQARELFLARDRFGIKPLYYVNNHTCFAFASEIKALVGQRGLVPFAPNDQAIYRYLASGRTPPAQSGQTFFQQVQSLPPGHWLKIQPGTSHLQEYWSLPREVDQSRNGDTKETVKQYQELFFDSIRLHLRSDVAVGTCLSGGLDSSSIVCVVNRLKAEQSVATEQIGQQQKTFSAVYTTDGRYNEQVHIDRVLQATGVEGNFTFPTQERLRQVVDRLIWHQDEPFGSTSIFAQWCVMSAARERGVTVLLDGQGADEVLAGYRPFEIFLGDLLVRGHWSQALEEARAIHANTGLSSGALLTQGLKRQAQMRFQGGIWPRQWLTSMRQQRAITQLPWLNANFVAQQHLQVFEWAAQTKQVSFFNYLRHAVQDGLPDLLRYEDRNSMAFSIEARVPFLDYRLVEFSMKKAAHLRIQQGWTKWILRQAMADILPPEIAWRKDKVGFETPEIAWTREWMQNEPDFFADDALCRDYVNLDVVRQNMKAWLAVGEHARRIWRWINLELWLRVWQTA